MPEELVTEMNQIYNMIYSADIELQELGFTLFETSKLKNYLTDKYYYPSSYFYNVSKAKAPKYKICAHDLRRQSFIAALLQELVLGLILLYE